MSRRNSALLLAIVVVVGLVYVWRRGKEPVKTTAPAPTLAPEKFTSDLPDTEPPRIASLSDTLPELPSEFTLDEGDRSPVEAKAEAIEKAEKTLALYIETLRYPLFSRPADASTLHILEWNKLYPAGQPFAVDDKKREVEAFFTLDKMFAGPGEPLTGTLEVFRREDENKIPVPTQKPTGRIEFYVEEQGDWLIAEEIQFEPRGNGFVTTFTPSTIEALADMVVETRVVARVELGTFFKELDLPFRYAATKSFEVLGMAGDKIKDGSLEVSLNVDVKHVAPVLIQAGLYDATGTKPLVVYDEWHRPEATGPQVISILMFGKAIRESGVNGPYRIKRLHGLVKVPNVEPPEVFWSHPDEPPMMTHSYQATSFSSDDYSSPEKDEKIQQYKDFIKDPL